SIKQAKQNFIIQKQKNYFAKLSFIFSLVLQSFYIYSKFNKQQIMGNQCCKMNYNINETEDKEQINLTYNNIEQQKTIEKTYDQKKGTLCQQDSSYFQSIKSHNSKLAYSDNRITQLDFEFQISLEKKYNNLQEDRKKSVQNIPIQQQQQSNRISILQIPGTHQKIIEDDQNQQKNQQQIESKEDQKKTIDNSSTNEDKNQQQQQSPIEQKKKNHKKYKRKKIQKNKNLKVLRKNNHQNKVNLLYKIHNKANQINKKKVNLQFLLIYLFIQGSVLFLNIIKLEKYQEKEHLAKQVKQSIKQPEWFEQ
ncbi:hypothetical protein IMG5_159120, partial [Ichthyophthirius multifiliis]